MNTSESGLHEHDRIFGTDTPVAGIAGTIVGYWFGTVEHRSQQPK
jgi:hypothetical protein